MEKEPSSPFQKSKFYSSIKKIRKTRDQNLAVLCIFDGRL